jgi:hypothetical protein
LGTCRSFPFLPSFFLMGTTAYTCGAERQHSRRSQSMRRATRSVLGAGIGALFLMGGNDYPLCGRRASEGASCYSAGRQCTKWLTNDGSDPAEGIDPQASRWSSALRGELLRAPELDRARWPLAGVCEAGWSASCGKALGEVWAKTLRSLIPEVRCSDSEIEAWSAVREIRNEAEPQRASSSGGDGFGSVHPIAQSVTGGAHGTADEIVRRLYRAPTTSPFGADILMLNMILRRGHARADLPMPWESGVASHVLSGGFGVRGPSSLSRVPALPPISDAVELEVSQEEQSVLRAERSAEYERGIYRLSVRKLRDMTWQQTEDALHERAVLRTRLVIEDNVFGSRTGRQIVACLDGGGREDDVKRIIVDTIAGKSNKTVLARMSAMAKYIQWLRSRSIRPSFPLQEHNVYEYLKFLEDSKAAPTKPSAFLSAVRFSHYTLGIDNALEVTKSRRIEGSTIKSFHRKRTLLQRSPFTSQHVLALEVLCKHGPTIQDRVMAGYFCFLVFSRSRYSDAMRGSLTFDTDAQGNGFVELAATHIKTGRTKEKKRMLLPLVAPAWGIASFSWAAEWKKSRALAGLDDGFELVIQPAPKLDGGWTLRGLAIAEASSWLRDALSFSGCELPSTFVLGTHTCKSTMLSWCAKFGVDPATRRILGYHVAADEVSTFTYGRDNQAFPLRRLEEVIVAVRTGKFHPDQTRSGRFQEEPSSLQHASAPSTPIAPPAAERGSPTPQAEGSSSTSSSSSSSSDESGHRVSEDEGLAKAMGKPVVASPGDRPGHDLFQHNDSGVLHWRVSTQMSRFVCNRIVSKSYTRIKQALRFAWHQCKQCCDALGPES